MSGELDRLGHPEAGSLAGTPGIGVIGAGWIVRECHLPSYAAAGAEVVGITSRDAERCRDLAAERGIRAFESWEALVDEPAIEVVDIAYPPDVQPELIARIAARGAGIRGILAQKPLAPTLAEAAAAVRACEEHGVVLAVNQNMRWDHSIRALKRLLDDGRLGEPVMAQITMHARVGWMPYAEHYPRKGMLIMSVHHLDAFRFLFGDPSEIVASVRAAPGTDGADEMAAYTLRYPEGLLAVGIDNTYATLDQGIEWRVDGTGGAARGTLGWPDHPWGSSSTLRYVGVERPEQVLEPRWTGRWFPDAFAATMAELLGALAAGGEPSISGRDNLGTMALLEAAYRSAATGRAVSPADVMGEAP
ncbi:MAG: Gfo/Idh/MocA family oxidoreductase [Solirubrobacterales bacterium]